MPAVLLDGNPTGSYARQLPGDWEGGRTGHAQTARWVLSHTAKVVLCWLLSGGDVVREAGDVGGDRYQVGKGLPRDREDVPQEARGLP